MPYSLRTIFEKFQSEVIELNQIVKEIEATPTSLKRDTQIEGCFLRFVVNWETFVEEYFLRCLCNAKTRSNYIIKPHSQSIKSTKEAFKKIQVNRKDRDRDYIDWLDSKKIQLRIDDYFRSNSRVQKLNQSPDKTFELVTIRNAIAHRSIVSMRKFEKYVKDQLGYLATLNPSMADLLLQKRRGNHKVIFVLITEYFLDLSDKLTK